jgi:hypothetical protein
MYSKLNKLISVLLLLAMMLNGTAVFAEEIITIAQDGFEELFFEEELPAEETEEQTFVLREVPVTVGAANDLDIVVSGEGLQEGVRVVHVPENYRALVGQTLQRSDGVTNEILAMMGRGG